jgi:hypothetical protein
LRPVENARTKIVEDSALLRDCGCAGARDNADDSERVRIGSQKVEVEAPLAGDLTAIVEVHERMGEGGRPATGTGPAAGEVAPGRAQEVAGVSDVDADPEDREWSIDIFHIVFFLLVVA